jgi:hypothetical protein
MKALLKYRPDLRECELDDRRVLAIPNLGAIVLTPVGYVLVSHLPGIAATIANTQGDAAILTSFATLATGSISSIQPGTVFGLPGGDSMVPVGASAVASVPIMVGSGANDASAFVIPPVTRNSLGQDVVIAVTVLSRGPGDGSAVLPSDQVYRGGLPVTATVGFSQNVPGHQAVQEPAQEPADPLPLRIRKRPHRLGSSALGNLIRSHTASAP